MEWRIRENSRGGYVAERGIRQAGGVLAPSGMGVTMPAFITYEEASFATRKEAERYILRKGAEK